MVNWTELQEVAASALLTLRTEITSSWFYLQIGIILCAAGLAHLASKLIRSRIDRGAVGAGLPAPLRLMLRVFIRNLATALFVVLLFVARAIMLAVTWPSHSYLLGVAMALARHPEIVEAIKAAKDDPLVRAIVLRVESPGGSSLASDIMWREISRAAAAKPLIVSMGNCSS